MSLCKIGDVNVVADAGAILRVAICAIDGDIGSLAGGGLQYEGNEMSFRIVVLSNLTIGICTSSIEVAQ